MTELNKYILIAMNYKNHTEEELDVNFSAASDNPMMNQVGTHNK